MTQTYAAAHNEIWSLVQRGLVYPSPYAIYATFWRLGGNHKKPITKNLIRHLMHDVRHEIHSRLGSSHTSLVVGVGFPLWREWSAQEGIELPRGMNFIYPDPQRADSSTIFSRSGGTFVDAQADLWFHIKSDDLANCEEVLKFVRDRLENVEGCVDKDRTVFQPAARKLPSLDNPGGKVLGCRFSENLNNPTDPVSIEHQTIVGDEDPAHRGASFVFAQRFRINWDHILNMSPEQIEDLVGRTTDDILIPSKDTRSHIKCGRVQNEAGDTVQILRLGLPFGHSTAVKDSDLRSKGASIRDEEGIYFAGYARSVHVFESILNSQIGSKSGFMRDRLLANVRSDVGGFFYVPSQTEIGLPNIKLPAPEHMDVTRFPGVDWSRLNRHFTQRSANGYMFYNHKDYLYTMSTATGADRRRLDPPSNRVLQLLANTFSRWQDNWYFDRKQQELEHLSVYLERKHGAAKAAGIMALSVAERMGWTIKVSLGDVFTSKEYGFRGRRQNAEGNWINGADTYHIHPLELLVGALPSIGLGQGRYVIDYARPDEQMKNFFLGLSFASGVGHTVPLFQRVLDKGLNGMLAEVSTQRESAKDASKREFYAGVVLALEGVRDYCLAFAQLAHEMAEHTVVAPERENLRAIESRMKKLSSAKPETMLEAAQLIFTLHACLHLIGEPTAIGRLDQMLAPFYEADIAAGRLTPADAQEIIDCFWIKVGEKVQINRTMVEDHQPYGNLAMGGSSGNYPQGAANNQWIQQVTVGGTIADDDTVGKPAYNEITRFCIRAARRLPLNAPCLSLRTRKDMPDDILHEAALALLSGGAHPILLCDEKIIPGLQVSGDDVGDGRGKTPYTPVREKSNGLWDSRVKLRVARDYACDGCYEPQLSGTSWFTLGGLTTPQVLEAALNQGKAWASAGPIFFRGQRISFTSVPPNAIRSFEQLLEIFFEHLRWMYAKQVDSTLAVFGQMSAVCPSPLLSALTEGCLEKGLDYYAGGPLYNVIAPGFIGLSTVVDSLWAIKTMVFDPVSAVTSLPELVEALICDWGSKMDEPFVSVLEGPARIAARAERFQELRKYAVRIPKFGRGNAEVDAFGREIFQRVAETARRVFTEPEDVTAQKMISLAQRIGTPEHPFGGFQIQPGVGTFENYVEFGAGCGASADGRHLGEPLASDLSPSPTFADLPVSDQTTGFLDALAAYGQDATNGYSDGAPADFSIHETFPPETLASCLRAFANGSGSNILTVTCADAGTMEGARKDPEKYDVVRARMGGWTEFFVAMFPNHQLQHERRAIQIPETKKAAAPADSKKTAAQAGD